MIICWSPLWPGPSTSWSSVDSPFVAMDTVGSAGGAAPSSRLRNIIIIIIAIVTDAATGWRWLETEDRWTRYLRGVPVEKHGEWERTDEDGASDDQSRQEVHPSGPSFDFFSLAALSSESLWLEMTAAAN